MENGRFKRLVLCQAVLAAAVIQAPVGLAAESTMALEEVTVTARRRTESLQDTPISVTAFSAEGLESRGIYNISQISYFTPNLTFQNNPSFGGASNAAAIYIRGVGQKEFVPTTDPGVGLYVDGVYVARSVGAIMNLVDVEQVEVLRGPQGTLFGRNTIGGAVSITTKKPSDQLSGDVSVKLGSDDRLDVKGAINLPFTDSFFGSLAIGSFQQDGYVERPNGSDLGDDDTLTGRLALRWLATEDLEINFSAEATRDRENGSPMVLEGINLGNPIDPNTPPFAVIHNIGANLAAGGPPQPCANPGNTINLDVPGCYDYRYAGRDDETFGTNESYSESDLWAASLHIDWLLSDRLSFKSITAVRDLDSEFARDGDQSPMVITHYHDTLDQEQFSQEFQLLGNAFNGDLQWIAGLYYFDESGDNENTLDFTPSYFRSGGEYDNTSAAVFLQGSYDFSERWSMTLGVRYTDEEKKFLPDQIIYENKFAGTGTDLDAPFLQAGTRVLPYVTKTLDYDETTPLANLTYRANDDLMLYGTYSEGFKSGGFSQRVFPPIVAGYTAPAGTPDEDLIPTYDPEYATSYELGFKYNGLDNRLRLNGAVFYTEYDDLQIQVFTSVAPVTKNAASAELQGFELELQAVPVDNLYLEASVGYIDASYDDLDEEETLVSKSSDLERIPEWTASAALSYEFGLGDKGVLTPRLDWIYSDSYFNDTFNTPEIAQEDDYHVWNFNLTWDDAGDNWQLMAGVINLADEQYVQTGVYGDAFQAYERMYNRGRQWFASARYRF